MFVAAVGGAFAIGLVCAFAVVHFAGGTLIRRGSSLQLTAALLVVQIVAYIPLLAAAVPLLPFAAHRSLREIGLYVPTAADVGVGAIGAVAMFLVGEAAAIVQKFALHIEGTQQAVALFGTTHDRTLIYALVVFAVFIAPVVEELIFRGFVFNALLRYVPAGIAAVVSGILFSLAHGDRVAFFPLACAGMVLALVYYRTGSLVSSMLTHGTFNAFNVVLVLATGGKG